MIPLNCKHNKVGNGSPPGHSVEMNRMTVMSSGFCVCINLETGRNRGIRVKLEAYIRLTEFETPWVVTDDLGFH